MSIDLGCGSQQIITEPPVRPGVKALHRPHYSPQVVVPVPGPPGKDATVVIEGEFTYTHVQTELAAMWTFANPLGRPITSVRVIYPTTPQGETVWTRWDTNEDGTIVYVDNKHPATGRAIIS